MADKKPFNLADRTYEFARDVRSFVKNLKPTLSNLEDGKQVIKSSGSVGANYIEANEPLGEKDAVFRIKISRKEAKETHYWLKLLKDGNDFKDESQIDSLIEESMELRKIFSTILKKKGH